jgi:hypothetical protein
MIVSSRQHATLSVRSETRLVSPVWCGKASKRSQGLSRASGSQFSRLRPPASDSHRIDPGQTRKELIRLGTWDTRISPPDCLYG